MIVEMLIVLLLAALGMPLFAVIAMLCGCAVYTPSGSVVVDPHATVRSDGGFCPPGQAKKGRC